MMMPSASCLFLFVIFAGCFLISKSWMHQQIENLEAHTEVLLAAWDFWISQNPTRKSDDQMKQIRMIQNPHIGRDAG
jgi:hypothetical protein